MIQYDMTYYDYAMLYYIYGPVGGARRGALGEGLAPCLI